MLVCVCDGTRWRKRDRDIERGGRERERGDGEITVIPRVLQSLTKSNCIYRCIQIANPPSSLLSSPPPVFPGQNLNVGCALVKEVDVSLNLNYPFENLSFLFENL